MFFSNKPIKKYIIQVNKSIQIHKIKGTNSTIKSHVQIYHVQLVFSYSKYRLGLNKYLTGQIQMSCPSTI